MRREKVKVYTIPVKGRNLIATKGGEPRGAILEVTGKSLTGEEVTAYVATAVNISGEEVTKTEITKPAALKSLPFSVRAPLKEALKVRVFSRPASLSEKAPRPSKSSGRMRRAKARTSPRIVPQHPARRSPGLTRRSDR